MGGVTDASSGIDHSSLHNNLSNILQRHDIHLLPTLRCRIPKSKIQELYFWHRDCDGEFVWMAYCIYGAVFYQSWSFGVGTEVRVYLGRKLSNSSNLGMALFT